MAPFWEKSKGFFKRVKNHDVQAGKPPDIIAGSAGLTKNTPKSSQVPMGPDSKVDDQIDSPIVRSASLTQQSPSIDLPTPSPEATPKVSTLENASRPAHSVPSSLRGSLWNQAYDLLKVEESDLVDAYERILSRELGKGEWDAVDLEPQNNVIGQGNSEQRRSQMMRLIQAGLDKTGKEATVKQKISDGMQVVQSVRGIIDRAVKASPEASLAWVGVCFGLEILANPINEAIANRSGLSYVISRMDWYWNLSDLLLSKNRIQKSSAGLRDELEKHVIDLYKSLLAYQMRSIYSYYRNRGVVFFRDLIKLDDWKGSLDSIESAENTVRDDSSQYNTLQIRSHLQDLVDMAGSEEQKLRDIYSAILRQTAQHEKTKEAEELRKCLRDLRATDPRHDKVRIEQTKGGLLRDSYCWIFENASFQQWRDDPERTMLWIKADPGKGKTMLVCGIIDELKSQATSGLMSFFFCQATDSRINNATSVLRGLIYLLADQQPSLASHLQEKYDYAGKSLFEDANSWVALSDIFKNILQDPGLETTYLVIDALDECVTDLTKLLDLIISIPSTTRVKWLLSSRNELHIEQRLRSANEETKLSLELKENAEQVSQAVNVYIRKKLSTIDTLQDTNLRDRVRDILHRKANGTFLWVALVIQELERPESWDPLQVVEDVPTDLYQLYDRMVTQIQRLPKRNLEICRQMLSISTIAYRPLHVAEIGSLCKFQADTSATDITVFMKTIRKIIAMCGSFLTVRDNHVYLIHQSAKDYLSDVAQATVLLSQVNTHYDIFLRSLDLMSSTLQRDMYRLVEPAFPIDQVQVPAKDPLAMIRYSCVHWINHLYNSISEKGVTQDGNLQDGGAVYIFFQKRYLYWLEALSLCRSISEGVKLMAKLKSLLQTRTDVSRLIRLVHDAHRFIMYHKVVIENSPLQIYESALMCSPTQSLIRYHFNHEESKQITILSGIRGEWGASLQGFKIHSPYVYTVYTVEFSPDCSKLASVSDEDMVQVWDTDTGTLLQKLKGHSSNVKAVAFSPDGSKLASCGDDHTIQIWDVATGILLQTLEGHSSPGCTVAFSPDGSKLASAQNSEMVRIWDVATSRLQQTLEDHSFILAIAFSPDGSKLASGSYDKMIRIWDTDTGTLLQTLEGHSSEVKVVAFSPDGSKLASCGDDHTIQVWNVATGILLQTLKGHSPIAAVAFSPDGSKLASGSSDKMITIWDATTGMLQQTLDGYSFDVNALAFSPDSSKLASASHTGAVQFWDVSTSTPQTLDGHSSPISTMVFSPDGSKLASGLDNGKLEVWNAATGKLQLMLKGHSSRVNEVTFSPDGWKLASCSGDGTIRIWDAADGSLQQMLKHGSQIDNDTITISFSPDGSKVASGSQDGTVRVWDVATSTLVRILVDAYSFRYRVLPPVYAVALSLDGSKLASSIGSGTVQVWDVITGTLLHELDGDSSFVNFTGFSSDGSKLTARGTGRVRVWDVTTGMLQQTLEEPSEGASTALFSTQLFGAYFIQCHLFVEDGWLTVKGAPVLCLPHEYRPLTAAISRDAIALGGTSGLPLIVKLKI